MESMHLCNPIHYCLMVRNFRKMIIRVCSSHVQQVWPHLRSSVDVYGSVLPPDVPYNPILYLDLSLVWQHVQVNGTTARITQIKLCNHVATWMELYFVQTCVAQNIFAQHDWSWMYKLVLHKSFLRNTIHRECKNLCCTNHFWATWLIVKGQTCVAQTILRNMIDREWAPLGCLCWFCTKADASYRTPAAASQAIYRFHCQKACCSSGWMDAVQAA
jgi:hypothetical protein